MFRKWFSATVPTWIEVGAIAAFGTLALLAVVAYGDAGTSFLFRRMVAQLLDAGELYTMGALAQPPAVAAPAPAWTNAELTRAVRTLARHAAITEMFVYVDTAGTTTLVNVTADEADAMQQKVHTYREYLEEYARLQAAGSP